jgi:hypothetical protein
MVSVFLMTRILTIIALLFATPIFMALINVLEKV